MKEIAGPEAREDRSWPALDFIHGCLRQGPGGSPALPDLLRGLADAFAAAGAGLAVPLEGRPVVLKRVRAEDQPRREGPDPWEEQPDLLARARMAPAALTVARPDGAAWLVSAGCPPEGGELVLWVEGTPGRTWTGEEAAALALAAQAVGRQAAAGANGLGAALERARLQQHLEEAAAVAGRLAHDFGNLLTGIIGFAELSLAQLPPDSVPHSYISEVWQSGQHGARWVSRLRLFSRRRPPEFWPASPAALIREEEARLRPAWGSAAALEVRLPTDLPPVALDGESVRQVLAELLENAREAVPAGGAVIVSASACTLGPADCAALLGSAAPGRHVELVVTDAGPGLGPEGRRRLFREVFYSTKPRHRGLGLAVVYGILRAYGGGFRLDPDTGAGTTVRVYLPAAAVPAPESAGPAEPAPDAAAPHLLVVDDDPLVLQLICSILKNAGYRVQGATGPAEALERYRTAAEPFALVLTDVVMPGMNGFELVRRLQQRDWAVNALFISSQVPGPGGRADEPGLTQFELLEKPFRRDALLRAVRNALERGRRY
jgi:signal transduction histidine kinase/CheY-like chemotaxis protein